MERAWEPVLQALQQSPSVILVAMRALRLVGGLSHLESQLANLTTPRP
jgi:hypothetical protein